jgi:hypothetical protein
MTLLERDILIISGEGTTGTWERYKGKKTFRAIKRRLTKERCNGDRWAEAYVHMQDALYAPLDDQSELTTWREVYDTEITES